MNHRFSALVLLALSAACATSPTSTPNTPATTPAAAPLIGAHGFDVSTIDPSVRACDDFYQYAVGKWRQSHPLPSTYPRYGRFEEVAEHNRDTERQILEEAAGKTGAAAGSNEQKIGDFYAACMNEAAIESQGLTSIQPELDRIAAIHDRASLDAEVTRLHIRGYGPLFRFGASPDAKNSRMVIGVLGQTGLSLPDRDYYLEPQFAKYLPQYNEHLVKMLTLSGESADAAAADAARILALETKLARIQTSRVENRDPESTYHITSAADVAAMVPNFDFPAFFRETGFTQPTLNVAQPKYLQQLNALLDTTPIDDWKALLRWQVLHSTAQALPKAIADEDFRFFSGVLSGTTEQQERWRRCVRSSEANIGQIVGQEYVRRRFSPEAKAKMDAMISNLIAALRSDIPTLSWMGSETKTAAIAKLDAFRRRIGYPDAWRSYAGLDFSRASYAQNLLATRAFTFHRAMERIGKPDDPNDWGNFTPATVNASYSPPRNDITFPAGILQPPFYDPNADDAYNYGGIGSVIGHEMTHGFDDSGSKYDPQGNLRNWWTKEDREQFEARASCIANQYSEFAVAPGVNIKGRLVLGEAIADLGGVTIALAAYEKSLEGKPRQIVDGFTPEQRFFLGFAQVWAENMSLDEQRRRAVTDPHAQGPFRVNATVSNMPAFQKAFQCAEGSGMVREASKRCSIW